MSCIPAANSLKQIIDNQSWYRKEKLKLIKKKKKNSEAFKRIKVTDVLDFDS